jgi:integrase
MAAIRVDRLQSGKRRHRVRVRMAGRYWSGSFPTRKEAQRQAAAMERQFCLHRLTPLGQSEILTLGELVEKYRRQVLPYKKWRTQQQQGQQLDWWLWFLGTEAPLANLTPDVLSLAKEELAPRSAKTINRYLAVLSHVFSRAVKEWRCMELNPLSAVSRLPEGEGRTRWLNVEERRRLLLACRQSNNPVLATIVVCGLSTGARRSELQRMEWTRLDLWRTATVDGQTVEIGRYFLESEESKTDTARVLIFFGEALRLLRVLQRRRRPGVRWVFPSPRDACRPHDFRYSWEQALERAQIENFCFHDLRHSAASYLGQQGASLPQIGTILGHKNVATTKKYTHFTSAGTEPLLAGMSQSIFGRV